MNPPTSLVSNAVIAGGSFTLINNNHNVRSTLGPLDRLLQAVSPSAFHNSGERNDPPRCLSIIYVWQHFNPPFLIFIASRLEHDIETFFGVTTVDSILTRVILDQEYHPDADITKFLKNEFHDCRTSHPFKHLTPPGWPPTDAVYQLVGKASGQFIYASTVTRYVKSPRRNPAVSLDIVLGVRPASGSLPFAQLDALYTHILSNVEHIDTVLKLLNFMLSYKSIPIQHSFDSLDLQPDGLTFMHFHGLELLFSMELGTIDVFFCDLRSLMEVEADGTELTKFTLKHVSFHDFLCDHSRSGVYYIGAAHHTEHNFAMCLDFLGKSHGASSISALNEALKYLRKNVKNIDSVETSTLVKSLKSFSVPHWLTVATTEKCTAPAITKEIIYRDSWERCPVESHLCMCSSPEMFVDLFVDFVRKVKCSTSAGTWTIQRLSPAMDNVWDQLLLGARTLSINLDNLQLALLSLSNGTVLSLSDATGTILQWEVHSNEDNKACIVPIEKVLVAYLSSSSQHSAKLKRKTFADAAHFCLEQLCAHLDSTVAPEIISERLRRRRICFPWKWHRRIIKEHVGDNKETPWMWLPQYGRYNSRERYSLRVQRHEIVYFTNKPKGDKRLDTHHIRYQMDQYHFLLLLVPLLLEKAGKSDGLVATCMHKRFTSMSQEFPQAMGKARSAMADYVARWSD
ncbi:hypothetical protein D9619_013385 [Psilocybe cf. subviscida]|uniref:Uncharacterized protein n=1 Tax=Psilocybe cf. subviscida TaxID=2480587 RepID=A0A8H5BTR1_9AGAR|nr:hypothetical protein D9619_013385 [Psilocybe cf. subviscida]